MTHGFTIVELLIVIVVIGILAAITVSAYTGIKEQAMRSSISHSLSSTIKRIEADKASNGAYPLSLDLLENSTTSNSSDIDYQYTSDGSSYCVTATLNHIAMYTSSDNSQTTEGVCDGHEEPITGPITDPVVHVQPGSFDTSQPATGGYNHPVSINYDVQPTDYVFILFNANYGTNLIVTISDNTPMSSLYSKSMGVSGYQKHLAFGLGGLTGAQDININACWSMSCTYDGASVRAAYVIYVIRGLGASPTLTATDTPHGVKPAFNEVVAPASQNIKSRRLAIFSYVYYGNTIPAQSDASNPALTWVTDSTASVAHLGKAIAARHAFTTETTDVQFQMTMPPSGTRYHGSVLFTFDR